MVIQSGLIPGSSRALVWLMVIPKDAAVPSRTIQRHLGSDWTTPASVVQQLSPGSGDLLPMKSRHGDRVIITLEHPLFCAPAWEAIVIIIAKPSAISIFLAAILSCRHSLPIGDQCQ